MSVLPVDERGYPVPAFVDTLPDGTRDFRFMSKRHWIKCITHRVCWVCGMKLGSYLAFLIGPMCAINRTTSEPPSHKECAEWSAQFCPFLARPKMHRREDELTEHARELDTERGCPILRNPGVALVWVTRGYRRLTGQMLLTVDDPIEVSWWAEGRPATRAEVEESIRTGYPLLMEMAEKDGATAMAALDAARRGMERLLPRH
jgi:hypothetical protein